MDKVKFITLVQREINLSKQGISLYDFDRKTYFELVPIKEHLLDLIWYEKKRNLIKLFRRFLNNKITIHGFILGFPKLSQICEQEFKMTRQDLEKLIILEFADALKGFHKEIASQTYILSETYLNKDGLFTWE